MDERFLMNPDPVVQHIQKDRKEFTRHDLVEFCISKGVKMLNFRYLGGDGRLKALNFVIQSRRHLEQILASGERVDGSSLFSHIEAGSSDLYVIPRYRTAFLNPFAPEEAPSLEVLCSYYDKDGNPLGNAPHNVLKRAHDVLKERTGYHFETMGELEYYIISQTDPLFQSTDQKGYHESYPFNKWQSFREEAMRAIAFTGANIKYGHAEVGNFRLGDIEYEQNEIEFNPVDVEESADQLVIAKWVLRALAYQYGVTVTFAPKITAGKAGSGMHIHTRLMKNGMNAMVDKNGLSDTARMAIAGYLDLAPSLTAFGNQNPTSYLRLVPHQEAPTNICWGDRNRSVLVRVPLGWCGGKDMVGNENPMEPRSQVNFLQKQTVEFRCPDGSADVYLLLAGLTVAVRHGLEMENALEYARRTYVDVNIFKDENKARMNSLAKLPLSCWESADMLLKQSPVFTQYNVFTQGMLEDLARQLKSFQDQDLREQIHCDKEKILKLVDRFIHCG
jgi:glutamine synthetase